jgi:hypothetical protein
MSAVENLDSKNSTHESLNAKPESDLESFVSGNFDVRAKFDFRLKSPWKSFRAFLGRLFG